MNRLVPRSCSTLKHVCILLAVAIIAAAAGAASEEAYGLDEMPYRLVPGMSSSSGVEMRSLSASGSLIVWEDQRSGEPDVYVYDLNDGRELRVSNTPDTRTAPAVSGSTVIWISGNLPDERTLSGVDLASGTEFEVTEVPGQIANPSISERLIAWQERLDGRWVIRVFDRSSAEIETFHHEIGNSGRPAVSGSHAVWQEHDGESWNVRVFRADRDASNILAITNHDDQYPVVSGEQVVFVRSRIDGGPPQLITTDLNGEHEQVLVADHFVQRPAIHGRLVVWEDWRSGMPDIYASDLAEEATFAIARSQQANAPAISGSTIAWISGDEPSGQRVRTLEIRERLPTDPHEPPGEPSSDDLYIQETQQFVSTKFKSFWQTGGPHVFGYPLTSAFTEAHPETGEGITVQYFERVRLEFHPEAAEDNRIRVALLGYEFAPGHETESIEPFESDESRRYFPETGQAVSYGFKEFWEDHGGLEIFGYPLTGEFTENGRTVQYFERARFEHVPRANVDEVQLGLLGRESLQERGWIPPPPVDTTQIFE